MSKYSESIPTYTTRTFAGVVEGGIKKKLRLLSPTYYQHEINQFPEGSRVTVSVTSKKPKRSEAQNRYYWGVYIPLISKETGEEDRYALHELFKGKFLADNIKQVLGEKVRIKKSTTALTRPEFTEYIMNIENMTGIKAPPTDNYFFAER